MSLVNSQLNLAGADLQPRLGLFPIFGGPSLAEKSPGNEVGRAREVRGVR